MIFSLNDLSSQAGDTAAWRHIDEHQLQIVATEIVELSDCGPTDAYCAGYFIRESHPELEQLYGSDQIEALAQFVLASEILSSSAQFQQMFSAFNLQYFGGHLPTFRVLVVFDIYTTANQPIDDLEILTGLIRLDDRCIFIRYTDHDLMTKMLIHEMAHAATSGEHDEAWVNEMRRLPEAGAPVLNCDCEF